MTAFPGPSALYSGKVTHVRSRPPRHRFAQPVLYCLFELEAISALARGLRLFNHNRLNLFSYYERDHGERDGSSVIAWVRDRLRRSGIGDPGGPVYLLTQPRVLGHVFNPLSVYLCHDPHGALRAVIYEVHNTYGEAHAYAVPVAAEDFGTRGICRHSAAKCFRVSPFQPMAGQYAFALQSPGQTVRLAVSLRRPDGSPLLMARLEGARRPFTDRSLLAEFLSLPFSTARASAAIYRQAAVIRFRSRRCGRSSD